MRGVVIAKMLVLMLWGLYLALGLAQPTEVGRSADRVAVTIRCA
jgi:hypothetical protein